MMNFDLLNFTILSIAELKEMGEERSLKKLQRAISDNNYKWKCIWESWLETSETEDNQELRSIKDFLKTFKINPVTYKIVSV